MNCTNCGNLEKDTNKFCTECGFKLSTGQKCNSCGTEYSATEWFCPECFEESETQSPYDKGGFVEGRLDADWGLSLFRNVEILISIGYKTYVDHYLTINNHMRRLWPKAFKLADVVFESVGRTDAYPAADLSVLQSTGADVEYLANIVTNILTEEFIVSYIQEYSLPPDLITDQRLFYQQLSEIFKDIERGEVIERVGTMGMEEVEEKKMDMEQEGEKMEILLNIGQAEPEDCLDGMKRAGLVFTVISSDVNLEDAFTETTVEVKNIEDFITKTETERDSIDALISIDDLDGNELWCQ